MTFFSWIIWVGRCLIFWRWGRLGVTGSWILRLFQHHTPRLGAWKRKLAGENNSQDQLIAPMRQLKVPCPIWGWHLFPQAGTSRVFHGCRRREEANWAEGLGSQTCQFGAVWPHPPPPAGKVYWWWWCYHWWRSTSEGHQATLPCR